MDGMGGVAGGEKYVVDGMLLKFAADIHGLYGNDDGNAGKAAAAEHLGASAVLSVVQQAGPTSESDLSKLSSPLLALVDYAGYRLVAAAIVPISPPSSLIHGSADGGKSLAQADPSSSAGTALAALGSKLNLEDHAVLSISGDAAINTKLAGDVEVHRGNDGLLYVLDTARMFPPDIPSRDRPGSHLYRLLRPEFLARLPFPLSSDAFSVWGRVNGANHNARVRQAVSWLRSHIIPTFATSLSSLFPPTNTSNTTPESPAEEEEEKNDIASLIHSMSSEFSSSLSAILTSLSTLRRTRDPPPIAPITNHSLTALRSALILSSLDGQQQGEEEEEAVERVFPFLESAFHEEGINIRYMGLVRSHTSCPTMRKILATEMVARTLKTLLRKVMRDQGDVLAFFNTAFGAGPSTTSFWSTTVVPKLQHKYESALDPNEGSGDSGLQSLVYMGHVFERLQLSTGTVLRTPTTELATAECVFLEGDLLDIKPRVPPSSSVLADAMQLGLDPTLIMEAQQGLVVARKDVQTAMDQFFARTYAQLETALSFSPSSGLVWFLSARYGDELGDHRMESDLHYARAYHLYNNPEADSRGLGGYSGQDVLRHWAHYLMESGRVRDAFKKFGRVTRIVDDDGVGAMGRLLLTSGAGSSEWVWDSVDLIQTNTRSRIALENGTIAVYPGDKSGSSIAWLYSGSEMTIDANSITRRVTGSSLADEFEHHAFSVSRASASHSASSSSSSTTGNTVFVSQQKRGPASPSSKSSVKYTYGTRQNTVVRTESITSGFTKPVITKPGTLPGVRHGALPGVRHGALPGAGSAKRKVPWNAQFQIMGRIPLCIVVAAIEEDRRHAHRYF